MYAGDPQARSARITVPALRQMKVDGKRIVALTAYDAAFAATLDAQGVDAVLVGDSLGMVVQGHDSTLPVSVADIAYHSACVARGLRRALLIADMPFLSYATPARAIECAAELLQRGGAAMVKLEGAGPMLEVIETLARRDVPVCAHLGLTPQSVLKLGGYKVQGRDSEVAARLRRDARAVQEAGAELLVLECVPRLLAAEITRELAIPTIGIGAGADCDGQILVLHDLLGLDTGHRRPRFVKDFLAEGGSIAKAIAAYVAAVRDGSFPAREHGYD
jgi:3-methyl-2-oxobutanoate hydroxymethyltransferase